MIAHNVYFTLKDKSEAAQQHLVNECKKYLTGHEGTLVFYCGTLVEEHQRDVNVCDFQVGLHMVFQDKAAHDCYHAHEKHVQFADRNRNNWQSVRVFDTWVD